jgi:glycosyltransferase involved in cell wall biosynthesis
VDSTVNGETGVVTGSETPRALAECIARLVKAPADYARLREKAWQRSKTFQWDQVLPPACAWLEEQARTKRR